MLYWLRIAIAAVVSVVERLLVRALALVAALLAMALIVVMIGLLLAWPAAAARERHVDRRWAAALEPLLSIPDRVLSHAASPTALEVEGIAAELGIEVAPYSDEARARPQPLAIAAWSAAVDGFDKFSVELVRTAGSLPVPSAEVERFLIEHRRQVEQLAELAGFGIPPRWECDLGKGPDGPRPSEEGLRSIQQVLTAELVSKWHRGDREAAAAMLAAAWRLNRSGLERPEMSSFLAAQETLTEHLAILRGMDPPPPGWLDRLVTINLERRYLQLLQVESWLVMRAIGRGDGVHKVDGAAAWLRGPVAKPFRRYAATEHAEAMCWVAEQIPHRSMAGFERGSFDAEVRETIRRWNRLARAELPPVAPGWQQTQRAVAGLELAELLLAVHELDRAGDRQLLDDLAGSRPSQVKGLAWTIVVEGEHLRVQLDGEPYPLPDPSFVALPLQSTVVLIVPPTTEVSHDVGQ